MGVFKSLAQWWKGFKTEFAVEKETEKQINRQDIKDVNEAIDEDRGIARGRQKQEERKRKSLEESVQNDRQKNVSQYLQKQKQQLKNKNFQNATSMRKLLQIAENQEVDLLSRDMQQKFGTLADIWFTQTGQIALVTMDGNGEPMPIATGPQTTDIFRNPGGLRNEVSNGVIAMNVNKKGQPVDTPENQKVPDMIMGPNGEFTYTESDQHEYLDIVGDKIQQISHLQSRAGAAERAMVQMSQRMDEMDRELEKADAISNSTQEALDRRLEEMKNAVGEYDRMERETARVTNMKQMSEELVKDVQRQRKEFTRQITKKIDKDEMDAKEDEIRRISNMTIDMMMDMADASDSIQELQSNQQQNQQQTQQTVEEE